MRIYIAGPLSSSGDEFVNVRNALTVANDLLERGYAPFVPHLTAFWHLIYPNEYEAWLDYDLYWLKVCDVLIRLPGESKGADIEEQYARDVGIPIYYSIEEFLDDYGALENSTEATE